MRHFCASWLIRLNVFDSATTGCDAVHTEHCAVGLAIKKIVNDEFQRYASNNKKQYRNIVGSSFEAPFAYANVFLLFRPLETDIVFKCTVQFRVPARDRKNPRKKNKIIDTLLFRFYHFRRHDCSWWFSVFSCPLILSSPISEARASHSVLWSTGLNCIISKFI